MADGRRWIQGIDEPLPEGEEILWSGSPQPRAVARHVIHERGWLVYLAMLAVGVVVSASGTHSFGDVVKLAIPPLLVMAVVWVAIRGYASQIAKTTEYVITSRRLVLRAGVAFPIVINVPLRMVDEAGMRVFPDGTGEVQVRLSPKVKLAYIALWPHVETLRHLANPRPKLRGLADPKGVGEALSRAIAADAARDGLAIELGAAGGEAPAVGALATVGGAMAR
ncbi:MAG: photosynthetic complex putative assembly protein PuhB [Gemmatimonadaceae bacterium]